MSLVVQKYGGSSVATADKIKNVAARIKRTRRGRRRRRRRRLRHGRHDRRADRPRAPDHRPPRGARDGRPALHRRDAVRAPSWSWPCTPSASRPSASPAPRPACAPTRVHRSARILAIEPERLREELDRGRIVIVAGFQGLTEDEDVATIGRGGSDTTAVAFAAALGRALRDLHRRRRRLHRRPAHRAQRPQAQGHLLRGDARARQQGREGHGAARRRARLRLQHPDPRRVQLRRTRPARSSTEAPTWKASTASAASPTTSTSRRSRCAACPTAPASPPRSSSRWPRRTSPSTSSSRTPARTT